MGYNMNLGSKENDTPGSFSEADWNRLSQKFQRTATGSASISGITGEQVNVPASIKTITATYDDPNKRVKALKDLYMGLSERSQREVSKGLKGYSVYFQ